MIFYWTKYITCFSLLLLLSTLISAQEKSTAPNALALSEEKVAFGEESYPALTFSLPEDSEEAIKFIEKYFDKNLSIDLKGKKGNWSAEKVRLNDIIPGRRGDLLFQVNEETKKAALAFRMGYDYVLSTEAYPEQMPRFRQLVNRILLAYYESVFEEKIKDHEKEIKDLEKEVSKNQKASKKLQKSIDANKKALKKVEATEKVSLENEIVVAQKQQEALAKQDQNLRERIGTLQASLDKLRSDLNALRARAGSE